MLLLRSSKCLSIMCGLYWSRIIYEMRGKQIWSDCHCLLLTETKEQGTVHSNSTWLLKIYLFAHCVTESVIYIPVPSKKDDVESFHGKIIRKLSNCQKLSVSILPWRLMIHDQLFFLSLHFTGVYIAVKAKGKFHHKYGHLISDKLYKSFFLGFIYS